MIGRVSLLGVTELSDRFFGSWAFTYGDKRL